MSVLLPNLRPPLKRSSALTDAVTRVAVSGLEDWAHELTQRLARLDALAVVQSASAVTSVTGTGFVTATPTTGDVVVSVDLSSKLDAANVSGTLNTVAKFTAADAIGDSSITDTGALVTVTNPLTVTGDTTLSLMTEGSVLFAGPSGLVSQDNAAFFWDDANNRLGLATNAPSKPLHVVGDACITGSSSILTVGVTGITMPGFTATSEFSKDGAFNSSVNSVYSSVAVAHCGEFMAFRGRGTAAAPSAVLLNDVLGQYVFTGAASATDHFSGVVLRGTATENWTTTNKGTKFEILTTSNAGGARATRVTVDQDGRVGVGVAAETNARLHVYDSASGALAAIANSLVTVERSGNVYATFRAPDGADKGLLFANATHAADCGILADNTLAPRGIQFRTGGNSIRLTVQSDGGIKLTNSATAAVSAANELRLRYNTTGHVLQVSANGGAYATVPTGTGTVNTLPKWSSTTGALTDSLVTDNGTTVTVSAALSVTGNAALGNAAGDAHSLTGTLSLNATAGTNGQIAQVSGGVPAWGAPSAAGISTGTGTAGLLVRWTGTSTQGDSVIRDNGAQVGIGTAASANAIMTFAGALGDKIHLYPVSATNAFGFGIQTNTLQYFVSDTGHTHSFGYGDSDAYTAVHTLAANGDATLNIGGGTTTVAALTATGTVILGDTMADSHTVKGVVSFNGTTNQSVIYSGANEHVIFRAGVATGSVILGDTGTASVALGAASIPTTVGGALTVAGNVTLGDAAADSHLVNGIFRASKDDVYFAWDDASSGVQRLGFTKKVGLFPKVTYGSGTDFAIAQSSGAGIEATNTFTDKLTISAAGAIGLVGATTVTGALSVTGNCTLGDAAGDSHTVNGALDCNQTLNVDGATTVAALTASGDVRLQGAVTSLESPSVVVCNGTADNLAFYGAAGSTQQTITGSRSGNAALASLLTALANLGIIVDSTT